MGRFLVFVSFVLLFSYNSFAKEQIFINNAFYGEDIDKLSYKDAKTAMNIWLSKLASRFNASSKLVFYTDFQKLSQDINAQKVDTLILSAPSYLKNLDFCKSHFKQGWIKAERDNKPFYRFVILSRKDAQPKQKYLVKFYHFAPMAKMVAQSYAWDHNMSVVFEESPKPTKPILDLFFKKCDLAVVKRESWELMQELNPQLTKKLFVKYETKRIFMDLVSLFSKQISKEDKELYFKAIDAINTTQEGHQLMRLFKFNGLLRLDYKQIAPMEAFYFYYLAQEQKYEK